MKIKLLLLISSLFTIQSLHSQQITPLVKREIPKQLKQDLKASIAENKTQKADSIRELINDTIRKIFVIASGSADFLQFDQANTSGALSLFWKPIERINFVGSINAGAAITKNLKSDSVYLSSLFFPDQSTAAGYGSIEFILINSGKYGRYLKDFKDENNQHQLLLSAEGSIQDRNIERDTITYNFAIMNGNYGIKYKYKYKRGSDFFGFTAGAFYNQIFLNKNNKSSFNSLYDNTYASNYAGSVPTIIGGFSFMFSFQYKNTILYLRTYSSNNVSSDLSFTVGVKVAGLLSSM